MKKYLLNEASQILDRADHVNINDILNTVHCPVEGVESLRIDYSSPATNVI